MWQFVKHRLVMGATALSFPRPSPAGLGHRVYIFPTSISKETASLGFSGWIVFSTKPWIWLKVVRAFPNFPGLSPSTHTHTSENTLPSVCKASASCLTSLIYKANRMFLLTHIMLSLLMKKTIPGGQPGRPSEPARKNSSNTQRVRSSKMIFHTMK